MAMKAVKATKTATKKKTDMPMDAKTATTRTSKMDMPMKAAKTATAKKTDMPMKAKTATTKKTDMLMKAAETDTTKKTDMPMKAKTATTKKTDMPMKDAPVSPEVTPPVFVVLAVRVTPRTWSCPFVVVD